MCIRDSSKIDGRTKGTPNKITLIRVDDLLLELGINPIQKLIEIAESDEERLDQRIENPLKYKNIILMKNE